jgi:hypothetical protein
MQSTPSPPQSSYLPSSAALAEARRTITDPHYAAARDEDTRRFAWFLVAAAKRRAAVPVRLHRTSPGDAA